MIKSNQHFFNALLVLFDVLIVSGSLLLAWYFRFASPFFNDSVRSLRFGSYLSLLTVLVPVYLILFLGFGLYKPYRKQRFMKECQEVILANTLGILFILAFLYTTKSVDFSRYMLGMFYIISIFGMSLERGIIRKVLRSMREHGFNINTLSLSGREPSDRHLPTKPSETANWDIKFAAMWMTTIPSRTKTGSRFWGQPGK